jgi:hypothetical protein
MDEKINYSEDKSGFGEEIEKQGVVIEDNR